MTDESIIAAERGAVPAWYWMAAVAALLFELIGCFFYIVEVRMSTAEIAALPLDQRTMLEARPSWFYTAFAIAVWVGLIGAIGLLLRKAWAAPLLLASMVAAIIQFSSIVIVPEMRAVTPSDALAVPIAVIIGCYSIWQLAKLAKRRGWLS
ncbi:MAG: hypothetical protein ACREBK_08245 [Sphingomicrobium sp.]